MERQHRRKRARRGIRRGYATASTDTGHQGGGGPWMQNREKLIDYGYRAVHEMTVKGKAIAAAFYGNQARLSYFTGCSAGGRQVSSPHSATPKTSTASSPARRRSTPRAARYSRCMWRRTFTRTRPRTFRRRSIRRFHNAVLQACDATTA
jgi:feruloyl esterase